MRYRDFLPFAILVAAACSAGVDGPTPDVGPAFAREGVKPPPPLGSQDTQIELSSPSSETPYSDIDLLGGPSAAEDLNQPFYAQVNGRYFANTQGTNGWISFTSNDCVVASPNAKLQYNEKNGKTTGHGTLTLREGCGGVIVLDLSKIVITSGGFGECELVGSIYECRSFSFSYAGNEGGYVNVSVPD